MRDFDDPQYISWRAEVRKRDGYKCRKCGSRKRLQIHHIKSWAKAPELRYTPSNGITLCRTCHQRIWGNEQAYERQCLALLADKKILADILRESREMEKKDV
jgi:5-methylcytosine-specific restriction endonuclease McrA